MLKMVVIDVKGCPSMPHLDTLSLKAFLLQLPSSNGSKGYMVEHLSPRPFQQYMALPLIP